MAVKGGQSLGKAMSLLRLVSAAQNGCTFTDLRLASSQPKATLHRLLQAMMGEGLLRFDEDDRRYRLGYGFLELAGRAWSQLDIRRGAVDLLPTLAQNSGETVELVILDGIQTLLVDAVERPHGSPMQLAVGQRRPAYCTAPGKAILAALPEEESSRILDLVTLERRTPRTVSTHAELKAQLLQIRRNGFALDDEEFERGIRGIAAPVSDRRGRVIGAVGLTVPTPRCDQRRLAELERITVAAAAEISLNCGGRPRQPEEAMPQILEAAELDSPNWLPEGDVPC